MGNVYHRRQVRDWCSVAAPIMTKRHLLSVFSGALVWALGGGVAVSASPALPERLERALQDGPAAVIVTAHHHLTTPTDDAGKAAAARTALTPILDEVRRLEADGHARDLRVLNLAPVAALTVDREGAVALLTHPNVASVETDDIWPVTTEEGLQQIGVSQLWQTGITGDGTAIAIIDTGIDPFHPTLGGAAIPSAKVVWGLDTADGDDDPQDCSGHGTAVASVAAGGSHQWSPQKTFAGGVAPEAKILAYKAAPDSACTGLVESAILAAIDDALAHRQGPGWGLVAINISAGGAPETGACDDLNPAMATLVAEARRLGVTVVTSSGNAGSREGISAPACLSGTLAVGSVWDSAPIPGAATFCLDGVCEQFCTDDGAFQGAMTCYTNAGPALDVLAPSEYLKVAEAGGLTIGFGGTSGAAPYVAGALALLRDLYPNAPPVELKNRLILKSRMVQAGSPALVRPLIQVDRALDPTGLVVGETAYPVAEVGQPTLIRSTARVTESGPLGGIRVRVQIGHPNPESLRLRLFAPDGTSVQLLEQLPAPAENRPLDGGNLVSGVFPVDLVPAESLGRLAGVERRGVWVLEASAPGDEDPEILNWGLFTEAPDEAIPAAVRQIVPVAARTGGADAADWRTHLQLVNPDREPAEVALHFGPTEEAAPRRTSMVVPAGRMTAITDVVRDLGLGHGTGRLVLESSHPVVGSAVVVAESTGIRQAIPVLPGEAAPCTGHPCHLLFLSGAEVGRSNLGVTDFGGSGGSATFEFFSAATGHAVGRPLELHAEPGGTASITDIHATASIPPDMEIRAEVTVDGAILPWASVVEASSSDALFVSGEALAVRARQSIPVVSRAVGRNDELWTTDIRLVADRDADFALIFDSPDLERPAIVELSCGAGVVCGGDDIVGGLFGVDAATGELTVAPDEPEVRWLLAGRIRALSPDRRTGQQMPPAEAPEHATVLVPWLGDGVHTRTNLVLTETGGAPLVVTATLTTSAGETAGTPFPIELAAHGVALLDPLRAAGAPGCADCSVTLAPLSGDGSLSALASVLDRTTGDPVTIHGHPIASP